MVAVDVVVVLASVTWKPAVARMVAAIPIAALDMNLGFGNEEVGTVVIGTSAAGTCRSSSVSILVAPRSSEFSQDVDGISESENLLSVWLRVTGGVWSLLELVLPVFPPLPELEFVRLNRNGEGILLVTGTLGEYELSESSRSMNAGSTTVVGIPDRMAVLGSNVGRPMVPKPVHAYSGSMSISK